MPKFNPDKYASDYKKRNYDQIGLLFPKGYRDKLRTAAKNAGFPSVNAMFNQLADEMIRKYQNPPEPPGESPEGAEQEPTTPTGPEADTEPED
jgi:hypothetical protein